MQKFSYHTHTNSYGIYDGSNSIEEMITKAEQLGLEEIGISNHLVVHPSLPQNIRIYFNSFEEGGDIFKRTAEDIRTEAQKHKIKVKVGFEVDFSPDATWRKDFENFIKTLDFDYLIGSSHSILSKDFQNAYPLYGIKNGWLKISKEEVEENKSSYWYALEEAIKSGYFDFIAHFDLIYKFNLGQSLLCDKKREKALEAFIKTKQPFELNTSIFSHYTDNKESIEMLKILRDGGVPTLISDDAHSADRITDHFAEAEAILSNLNYQNRWSLTKK